MTNPMAFFEIAWPPKKAIKGILLTAKNAKNAEKKLKIC
jgi:hypothetical protein